MMFGWDLALMTNLPETNCSMCERQGFHYVITHTSYPNAVPPRPTPFDLNRSPPRQLSSLTPGEDTLKRRTHRADRLTTRDRTQAKVNGGHRIHAARAQRAPKRVTQCAPSITRTDRDDIARL